MKDRVIRATVRKTAAAAKMCKQGLCPAGVLQYSGYEI